MSLEFTVEVGWDAHVHAYYQKDTYPTAEQAAASRSNFHDDFDSVVHREVGTTKWSYRPEDQPWYNRREAGDAV